MKSDATTVPDSVHAVYLDPSCSWNSNELHACYEALHFTGMVGWSRCFV